MLAQTIARLRQLEARDGRRRVFTYDAEQVGAEVPAYAEYVRAQVESLGRDHPLIKTQYYLQPIDAEAGMFPQMRRALMRGDHERQHEPTPGRRYAFLLDVAGEDEQAGDMVERALLANKKRDATALTIVECAADYGQLPTYRAVDRRFWLGIKHTALYDQLLALERIWHPMFLVVDATGIGAGLASFLLKALGEKVLPVVFSPKVKSDLGWQFLGVVETSRYRDYLIDGRMETRQFWYEVEHCQYQIRDGPGRTMSWGVWDPPAYDGLIARGHDDLLLTAALTAILDQQEWPGAAIGAAVPQDDVLDAIDRAEW
jgi:hypothetical protein